MQSQGSLFWPFLNVEGDIVDSNSEGKLVACIRLADGHLLQLQPFDLSAEQQAKAVPGQPLFASEERIENNGHDVIIVKIIPS